MKRKDAKGLTRREFLKGSLATAAVASASMSLIPVRKAWAAPDMRVGIIAPSHCAAPYFVTALSGRFKESGLNVEVIPYKDMKKAAGDLLGGKLQAAQLTLPLFLALRAGTGPVDSPKPVIASQITGTEGGAIVVKKGSGIKQLDQLEGISIASHTPLTVHYLILATLMEKRKFSPESVKNIKVRPIPEMVPALSKGEIDAFIMPEPVNSLAGFKKAGDILIKTRMLWKEHPCCLTATNEKFLGGNREMYQGFTDAMVRTGLEMDPPNTRAGMLEILKKSAPYGNLPPQVLASAFSSQLSGFYPYPYTSSFTATRKMMQKRGSLKQDSFKDGAYGLELEFIQNAMARLNASVPEPIREEKVAGTILA
jgi:ABC-type nitrate/sulfonate/bicarbonate transport system substrate-binding protein